MSSDYPYLEFIRIAKECRNILIKDTLESNSIDLYDALYSNSGGEIHQIKLELYEIKWFELHWKKINEAIKNKGFSSTEQKELISLFTKWYRDFIGNWNYTEFDSIMFEERMNILKDLILVNSSWEQKLKKMDVSFEQSKKILNKKLNNLKKKEY